MTRIILLFLVMSVAACGNIPKDSLKQYSDSFDKAHAASEDFLVQFGQTKKAAAAFAAANGNSAEVPFKPYPDELPTFVSNGIEADKAVETMRLAFEVIRQYNATLVALADEKGPEAVGSTAKGLANALGNFVPFAGTAASAIGELARELENARLRQEFKVALAKGAPKVREMIEIISENIETDYGLRVLLANRNRGIPAREAVDRVVELQKLLKEYASPPVPSDATTPTEEDERPRFISLADRQSRLDTMLAPMSKEPAVRNDYPYRLTFGPGTKEYGSDTEALVTAVFDKIQENVNQYEVIIRETNAVGQSGAVYNQMLTEVLLSLAALEAADKVPPNLTQRASELLRLAFLMKTQVEEIRAAQAKP